MVDRELADLRQLRLSELVDELGGDEAIDAVQALYLHPSTDVLDAHLLELPESLVAPATAMIVLLMEEKRGVSTEKVLKFVELMQLAKVVGWESGNGDLNSPTPSA